MKKVKKLILCILFVLFIYSVPVYAEQGCVKVGFIDTGISLKHIDKDCVADGKNYVFFNRDTDDRNGHGTATAGIMLGSKELGIEGVFPEAQAVPLVVYDTYPSGVITSGGVAAICQAIYDAIDVYGCRVINMSMGITEDSKELRKAVEYAERKGAVIVSAVGNVNLQEPERIYYPANYPTVIGVGASDGQNVADFSQRNGVYLVAQGTNLPCVTIRNEKEAEILDGTSYSCAVISSVCAEIISEYPQITPVQVRVILAISATDILENGFDADSGWGIMKINQAEKNLPLTRGQATEMMSVLTDAQIKESLIGEEDASKVLFYGVSENDFALDAPMTRAMVVTVLHRLEGAPEETVASNFSDVTADSWYADAVAWAFNCGIAKGVSETDFAPDESVTREQMLKFLSRYVYHKFSRTE